MLADARDDFGAPASPSRALGSALGDEARALDADLAEVDTPAGPPGGAAAHDGADDDGDDGRAEPPAPRAAEAPDARALAPPKKPLSAYFIFLMESGLRATEAGARWSALAADGQAEYQRRAAALKADYAVALAAYQAAAAAAPREDAAEEGAAAAAGPPPPLPLSLVCRHMKYDADVGRVSKEAQLAMQAALSGFVQHLGAEAAKLVARSRLKTIHAKDLVATMEQYHLRDAYAFLAGEIVPQAQTRADDRAGAQPRPGAQPRKRSRPAAAEGAAGEEGAPAADAELAADAGKTPAARPGRRAGAQPTLAAAGARITSFFNTGPRARGGAEGARAARPADDEAAEGAGHHSDDEMPARRRGGGARRGRRMLDDLEDADDDDGAGADGDGVDAEADELEEADDDDGDAQADARAAADDGGSEADGAAADADEADPQSP
jgi:histone H3/H4